MAVILKTNRGEVLLRTSTLADVDAYRELRLEGLKNHPSAFGQSYTKASVEPHEYWASRLSPNPDQVLYFAEYEDQLIGMTGIIRPNAEKIKHNGSIWGVYVRPAWRGQRIAESLVRACVDWAKSQALVTVKLAVVTSNLPAIHCYERCGFQVYGIEPKAIFEGGTYHDEYLMALSL